jgi:hypothetical protein
VFERGAILLDAVVIALCFAANSHWRKRQRRLQIYFGTVNANNIPCFCGGENSMSKSMNMWAATALMFTGAPLAAQDTVREACMPDIRNFCAAEMATFDIQKVRACLIENIKKTSPACQAAAKARRDAEATKPESN